MNLANARSSGSLHRQVRRMLVQCITIVLLLAMSVCLGIELHQEVRTRDQLLSNAAQMAADAYAHAIRPTHTTNDGDTIFVMATGEVEAQVDVVGVLATRALERAIADGARSATAAYGLPAARDLA